MQSPLLLRMVTGNTILRVGLTDIGFQWLQTGLAPWACCPLTLNESFA